MCGQMCDNRYLAEFRFGIASTVVVLVLAVGCLIRPAPARAQGTEGLNSQQESALEEIIVTARRREETLGSVPISISAYTGEQLEQLNARQAQDLTRIEPSLLVEGRTGRESSSYAMRGQGVQVGTGPAVSVYFAEVPFPSGRFGGGGSAGQFFDLDNIQVLKGPQGTLFGRNTTGGAVLFQPTRPQLGLWEGYAEATGGDLGLGEFQFGINVPIGDRFALRFSGNRGVRDGYTIDAATGRDYSDLDYTAGRVSSYWQITDSITNHTILFASESETNGNGLKLSAINPDPLPVLGGLTVSQLVGFIFQENFQSVLDEQEALGIRRTQLSNPQDEFTEHSGISTITEFELNSQLQLRNILSYQRFEQFGGLDFDGSRLPLLDQVPGGTSTNSDTFVGELQLLGTSFSETLEWVVGLYYEDVQPHDLEDEPSFYRQISFGGQPVHVRTDREESTQAAYGQLTLDLGSFADALSGLSFTGGLRYTEDDRWLGAGTFVPGPDGDPVACTLGDLPDCRVNFEDTFDEVTYNVSLNYIMDDGPMFYLTHRKGYKSGGFNINLPPEFAGFEDEVVNDIEVGLKTVVSIGGVDARLNVAAYRTVADDLQRNIQVLFEGQNASVIANVPESEINGGEFSLDAVAGRWHMGLGYAYTDAEYTEPVASVLGSAFSFEDIPYEKVPTHKVAAFLGYERPMSDDIGTFSFFTDFSYVDSVFHIDANAEVPSYELFNLRLGWSNIMGSQFSASAFVENVADEEFIDTMMNLYETTGTTATHWGPPRTYGFTVKYEW